MIRDQRLQRVLKPEERVLEGTDRKPHAFSGGLCVLAGVAIAADTARYVPGSPALAVVVLAALALIYAGVWILLFSRRERVYVTDERIIFFHVNLLGGEGAVEEIPLADVARVRLCKSAVSFKPRGVHGNVYLERKSKGDRMLPFLDNGQYLMEAIGGELPRFGKTAEGRSETEPATEKRPATT